MKKADKYETTTLRFRFPPGARMSTETFRDTMHGWTPSDDSYDDVEVVDDENVIVEVLSRYVPIVVAIAYADGGSLVGAGSSASEDVNDDDDDDDDHYWGIAVRSIGRGDVPWRELAPRLGFTNGGDLYPTTAALDKLEDEHKGAFDVFDSHSEACDQMRVYVAEQQWTKLVDLEPVRLWRK